MADGGLRVLVVPEGCFQGSLLSHTALARITSSDCLCIFRLLLLIRSPQDPEKGASPVNINPSSASQLEDEYIRVSDSKLLRTADLITTVISSVLPIASVIILYFVHSKLARLGVVAGFTALFSLTLGTMTASRRVEIFAATAA